MPTRQELEKRLAELEKKEEKQRQYRKGLNARYNEKVDRVNLTFPAGTKERIEARAAAASVSVSEYIRQLVYNDLNQDDRPPI